MVTQVQTTGLIGRANYDKVMNVISVETKKIKSGDAEFGLSLRTKPLHESTVIDVSTSPI
jgi:hypothetical protein